MFEILFYGKKIFCQVIKESIYTWDIAKDGKYKRNQRNDHHGPGQHLNEALSKKHDRAQSKQQHDGELDDGE